jgi:hypothetical protein
MVIFLTFVLLFVSLGSAQPPASRNRVASVQPAQSIVTNALVHDWLHVWQKRLRLEEWKIEVKIVRMWDLEQGTLGHIDWSVPHKTALIKVLSPSDYELPADKIPADMELSIVHELVHLHLAALPLKKDSRTAEEQVVSMIADALVNLEHQQDSTE